MQTIFSQQLDRAYAALREKYPILVRTKRALFQQDNATFEQLEGVEILPQPAYSPDLAPSDYGLFQSMQHFLRGHRFGSFDEVHQACSEIFASKPKFRQIHMLA